LTLTLRKEHRFRVFEGRVLKKIFGSKRGKLRKDRRKLHNDGFKIAPLTNIIGVMK